ncbi:MAG: pyruvate dehydrogenase (acetyl-transferring) E1 component subunit alpha [Nitriliruptoraceae bacterium]
MHRPVRDPSELLPPGEPVQLLQPDGVLREHPEFAPVSDPQLLRSMLRHMVVTRQVDQEAINLQRQGQLAVYASCRGQEAAQVGSALALADGDWIFPSYREIGAAITRGIDPTGLMHMYRGTWLADHDPYAERFGLMTIPIATQVLHATGFAMGTAMDGKDVVTVAYFGDGATSEGDAHEAMTFAGVFNAPVVFFVQNNQWAISVPVERQTAAPSLAHKAVGYGIVGRRCDGNDVLATYAVMSEAVERARSGGGPTLIEAMTYRMESHTTSDDANRYRGEDEVAAAAARDPIDRFQAFLARSGVIDDEFAASVAGEAAARSQQVRDAVYDAPHGDPTELFDHVYVDPNGHFAGQREQLARELAAGGGGV